MGYLKMPHTPSHCFIWIMGTIMGAMQEVQAGREVDGSVCSNE